MGKIPLNSVDNSHFHSTTQLRFTFTSDASGNDIGYWIDELVIIYDGYRKRMNIKFETNGVATLGGLPGDWSTTRLEMTNTGNISARYTPTANGVPSNWTHYFAYQMVQVSVHPELNYLPGESRQFDLRVMIDENSSQGNIPVTVNVTSNAYPDIQSGIQTIIKILPDRLPNVILPEFTLDALQEIHAVSR